LAKYRARGTGIVWIGWVAKGISERQDDEISWVTERKSLAVSFKMLHRTPSYAMDGMRKGMEQALFTG